MVHSSVRSLLTGRDLIVLSPLQTVFEAAGTLSSQIIGGAPVLEVTSSSESLPSGMSCEGSSQPIATPRRHALVM